MIYFTGDIHGRPKKIGDYCKKTGCTQDDIIVILGDVGANYFRNARDVIVKDTLNALGPTILCIHGNHEQRPANIPGYEQQPWRGGQVWAQREYPNLLFARDGDIFEINELRYLVIGGAYSVDKYYRLSIGAGWWPDEQPSAEIKEYVERQVANKQVDVILSHTCPFKYEPREMFIKGIDESSVDTSTEKWLDEIEEKVDYKAWLCGHWHTDKTVDRIHFLYDTFITDEAFHEKEGSSNETEKY